MFNNIHLKRINFSLERKKEEFPRIIQMNVKCCTNFFKTPESLKHQIQNWREDFSPKKKSLEISQWNYEKKKKFLHSNHNNKNFEKLKQRFVSEWHFWKKYSLERTLSVLIFNTNYIWHQWAKKILLKNWMFFLRMAVIILVDENVVHTLFSHLLSGTHCTLISFLRQN